MRHLRLWLGALDRVITAALEVQAERAAALAGRQIAVHAITPDHARLLAEQGAAFLRGGYAPLPALALDDDETTAERALLAEADALPLARLASHLAPHERAALLICAAAALSPVHERLFAYLVDDMARPHVSVELLLLLTAGEAVSEPVRRHDFGPGGRLARLGLVALEGPAGSARAIVRLRDPVLAWLGGAHRTPPLRLTDPDLIAAPAALPLPEGAETALAIAMLAAGEGVVAIWGSGDRAALAEGLAAAARRPLRRIAPARAQPLEEATEAALAQAAGEDTIAWLDLDGLPAAESPSALDRLGALLAGRAQPVLLSGRTPWRPPAILQGGRYAEVAAAEIDSTTAAARLAARAGIDDTTARDLTGRYRFTDSQQRVLAALADARDVESAARMAAATIATRFATLIEPRRGPDDLVLPAALHRQVVEIASFFAAAPVVDGRFGFGRLSAAPGAIKVLFTGDPGTGKTLAAEVVARLLGRQLLKVDLAQVTSKWVGETEKNLEAVFEIAEQTAAVLFFDEADTLFGKRGEVRHGTDRYANLEVGFLLQRLESCRGLVILASNLRNEIDPAFTRRFQLMLHFPRPGEAERRRLWQHALADGNGAPADVDLEALVRLDLTGAGIVGGARLASLIAATRGDGTISTEHVDEAIARQFRQEARLVRGGPAVRGRPSALQ
jgi:hypothetical protein